EKNDLFPMKVSNWWVVSQPYAGEGVPTGVMYNGPQIAALDPSRTYQVALKSNEGFQFAGNTYPGTINFWQGHNGNLAMGLTAGNIDVSDIFCVDLFNEDDRLFYKTKNGRSYIRPSTYQPVKAVAAPPVAPLFNVVDHNWPVVMIDENKEARQGDPVGTAYIQRYNWEGSTVSTLTSWMDALNAKTLMEWNDKLDTVGANFNLVALETGGKASYRLTGSLPIKRGMQQPNPDVPATEWDYFPSYDPRLPAAIAPEDGWNIVGKYYHGLGYDVDNEILANWNQKPFVNMPDGDLDYDSYFRFDRVTLIKNMLKSVQLEDQWTVDSVLNVNGFLQRLDVNYFAFKPFWKRLNQISEQPIQKQALFQIGNWGGQRGSFTNPEVDQLGAHYGHVLFYEWMNALTEQFANVIANSDKDLTTHLMKGLLKPKQPYLPTIKNGAPVKPRPTILTSHGIHVNARIMLNALHSAFEISQSETEAGAPQTTDYQYSYDRFQENLLGRVNPERSPEQNAYSVMLSALDTAIEKTMQYPGFSEKQFVSGENSYMANDIRTYSGMSSTLGRNDVSIGFRPGSIAIPHFRNRGPLNIAVQFLDGKAQGKNIAHPGIREFRNVPGAGSENHSGNDFSYNQIDMYEKNRYRDMHPLPRRPLHRSKL
ncbi:MAG: penicillin acylase family protein, partial [Pseudomonas marincola]